MSIYSDRIKRVSRDNAVTGMDIDWPPFLFRYLSLHDDVQKARARRLIVDRRIYFSRPAEFNDPFECVFELSFDAPKVTRLNRFIKYLQRTQGLDRRTSKKKAKEEFAKGWYFSEEHREHAINDMKARLMTRAGMVCLSAKNDNSLMWAHYADSHRGICVEFDMALSRWYNWPAVGPYPVEYCDTIPVLDWFNSTPEQIGRTTVLRKSLQWEYEKEWRFFHPSSGGKERPVPDAISRIILGMRASSDTADLVHEWIKDSGRPIRIQRGIPGRTGYDVELIDV